MNNLVEVLYVIFFPFWVGGLAVAKFLLVLIPCMVGFYGLVWLVEKGPAWILWSGFAIVGVWMVGFVVLLADEDDR